MVVTGSASRCQLGNPLERFANELAAGPKLCAGEELATAASKALGTDMAFENISEFVAHVIQPQWNLGRLMTISGVRQSVSSLLNLTLINPNSSTCLSTTALFARVRQTTLPQLHSTTSRESIRQSLMSSSKCIKMSCGLKRWLSVTTTEEFKLVD
jgi:hypothetical protein